MTLNRQQKSNQGSVDLLNVPFPYVHDLALLLSIVEQSGQEVPPRMRHAARLTRYAVLTRYPGILEPVTQEEYETAVSIANEIVKWVQEIVYQQKTD
ncbi:MAG: HEPN domain-containing protein [Anaerolineae bacterium]